MFETGVRQLRLVASMVGGRPISPSNVERLVRDAVRTLDELGTPGDDVQQILEGPFADPKGRQELQDVALSRTVRRLARVSPFYRDLLAKQGVSPRDVTVRSLRELPLTTKKDLIENPGAFIADGSRPFVSTRSTGTTGRPVEIWLSRYEYELWPALSALSGVLRGEVLSSDCMQVNISSRATAAVQNGLAVARLVGARVRMLGVVGVEESLDSLLSGGDLAPTLLSTYPSYLAQLTALARRRGMGPDHLRLRTVYTNGEVLSGTVRADAERTFGAPLVDTFGMTEVLPVSARSCEQGHLHHDLNMGVVEVVDPDTGQPAEPGAVGSVVITPFFPYRECMPVLRYDTRDLVRRLADGTVTCSLAGVPATTSILGKADHLLRLPGRLVTTRDLVEACDSLPGASTPVRFRARVVADRIHLQLPAEARLRARRTLRHFGDHDLPVVLTDVPDAGPGHPPTVARTVRADLVENTFTR